MLKYNGIIVPEEISPLNILPGFSNPIEDKVYTYIDEMSKTLDIEYTFPPILGYPTIIDEDDLGLELISSIEGEERIIEKKDINKLFWVVTDGFHRIVAAITTGKKFINVELDRNAITNIEELKEFDK